jgi:hypothetical protein
VRRYGDFRFDASTIRDMADGSIKVTGQLGHEGIITYRNPDGTPRREYRPAKTVFDKAALATFAGAPVTVNHPPQGKITAESWKRDAVGHLGDNVRQDGDHVIADMYVRDAATVASIKRGDLKKISCGYEVDYDPTPGEFGGQRYDGVQTAYRGNHVALLSNAFNPRGGPDCVLRLDSNQDEVLDLPINNQEPAMTPEQIAALEGKVAVLTGENTKLRADAVAVEPLQKSVTDLTASLKVATDQLTPERLDALVADRQVVCAAAVAAGVDPKGRASLQIKREIIAKRTPALATRVDAYSAETVDALLSAYSDQPHPSMKVLGFGNADPAAVRTDAKPVPTIGELRAKARDAESKMWQNGSDLPKGKN